MGTLLVECPVHGVVQASSNWLFGPDTTAIIADVGIPCPVPGCGRTALISDGTYEMRDTAGLDTIYRPTLAAQRRLQTVFQWAERELSRPDPDADRVAARVERALEKDAPGVLARVKSFLGSPVTMGAMTLATLLISVIALVSSSRSEGISAEDLERLVREIQSHSVAVEPQGSRPPLDRMPSVPPPAPGQAEPDQAS